MDTETKKKVKVAFVDDRREKPRKLDQKTLLFILKNSISPNLFKETDVEVREVSNKIWVKFDKSSNLDLFLKRSLPSELNSLYKVTKATKNDNSYFKKFTYKNGGGHWSLFVRGKKKEDFEQFGGEFNFTVRPNKMRRRGPPAYLLAFKELVDLFRFWVDPVSDMFAEVKFKVF